MATPQDFIRLTGAPVPGVATPDYMAQPVPAQGMPQLEIPDYTQPGAVVPPVQTAPSVPSVPDAAAGPTQFISRPERAATVDPAELLAPVGSIGTGTSTTVSKTDLGKAGQEAAAARAEADKQSEQAVAANVNNAQARAAFETEAAKARVEQGAKFDAEMQQKAAANAAAQQQHIAGIQKAIEDYDREASNVSGDRWYQNQTTAGKIGGLISIALSGLGQVFSAKAGNVNARNGALDLINLAVDRDIDAQKTALAAKERGIRVKESAYSMARQAGADDLAATEAAKAAAYGKIARDFEVKTAALGTQEAAARGQAAIAELRKQQADSLQKVAELSATHVQSTSGSRPVTGLEVAQLQGALNAQQQEAYRRQNGLVAEDPKLQTPLGQAPDAETARDLRGKVVAIEGAEKSVKAIRSILKGGGDRLDPQKRKALSFARTQLAQYIKSPAGANLGAALSDSEKELFLDEQLPDADFMQQLSGRTETTLKLLDQQFRDTRDSWKRAYTVRTH